MTVADVLECRGWPLGRRGRTSCPLHQSDNGTTFAYTTGQWYCHGGCGGGSAFALAERMGIVIPFSRVRGLESFTEGEVALLAEYAQRQRPSARLAAEHRRLREEALWWWSARHCDGLTQIALALRFRPERAHPLVREHLIDQHFAWLAAGRDLVEQAHRALERLGAPCECDPMPRPSPAPGEASTATGGPTEGSLECVSW